MADDERASNPGTQPFVPDFGDDTGPGTQSFVPNFDDTGPGTQSFVPNFDDTGSQPVPRVAEPEKPGKAADAAEPDAEKDEETESSGLPVQSVTVPGRYHYLKWWKLALVILGVWVAATEVGLSLFYWWYHSIDKTPAVFMVLVYVVVCVVGGVLLAMVQGRPLVSALSLAVMSGPFASVVAAAPLYGHYYCERVGHCLVGVIPY